VPDFLADIRKQLEKRLKELQPQVEEYHRVESALQALTGVDNGASSSAAAPRRRRARAKAPSGTGRRGRPKGSGTRANQALELVKARPGITIPELAEAMGIKQNYLYRVMPGLADDGKVSKSGRGWHARDAA
jgi:CRP-like cAMP-binding protein